MKYSSPTLMKLSAFRSRTLISSSSSWEKSPLICKASTSVWLKISFPVVGFRLPIFYHFEARGGSSRLAAYCGVGTRSVQRYSRTCSRSCAALPCSTMPARQSISSLRFILASRKVDSACFHEATPTFWFRSDCEGRLGIDAETLKGASRRGFRFCDPYPSSDSSGGAGPFRIQLYMSSVEGSASLEFSCLVVQPCEETKGRAAHRS